MALAVLSDNDSGDFLKDYIVIQFRKYLDYCDSASSVILCASDSSYDSFKNSM